MSEPEKKVAGTIRDLFGKLSHKKFVQILWGDPCPQPKTGYLISSIDHAMRLTKSNRKSASRWRAPTITIDLHDFEIEGCRLAALRLQGDAFVRTRESPGLPSVRPASSGGD
jgi:hypothetical protein